LRFLSPDVETLANPPRIRKCGSQSGKLRVPQHRCVLEKYDESSGLVTSGGWSAAQGRIESQRIAMAMG
jgi:hypothetical protein